MVLPVFAKDTFHGSGGTCGLLTTMLSVEAVLGSVVSGSSTIRDASTGLRPWGFGVTSAATAAAPNVVVVCVASLVIGATAFCFVTMCSTTLQIHSSSAHRGRIKALWVFVSLGTTPIVSIQTGFGSSRPVAPGPSSWLVRGRAWPPPCGPPRAHRPTPMRHSRILLSDCGTRFGPSGARRNSSQWNALLQKLNQAPGSRCSG